MRYEPTIQDLKQKTRKLVLQPLALLQSRGPLEGRSAPTEVNHQVTRDRRPWTTGLSRCTCPHQQISSTGGCGSDNAYKGSPTPSHESMSPKTFPTPFLIFLILLNLGGEISGISQMGEKAGTPVRETEVSSSKLLETALS